LKYLRFGYTQRKKAGKDTFMILMRESVSSFYYGHDPIEASTRLQTSLHAELEAQRL
jgi:hypothetical protein